MVLIWNDNLKTGISVIDEQHQELFTMISKLGRFIKDKAGFLEALIELQTYSSIHFKTEEDYMNYTNYPDYEHHKAEHKLFVKTYMEILKKINDVEEITDLGQELMNYVESWLEKHYTNEDVKMAAYLKQNSI